MGKRLSSSTWVPGSLSQGKGLANFYEQVLGASKWVVDTVRYGYVFPLVEDPLPTKRLKNNHSAVIHPEFSWAEVNHLEALGCIMRVD